MRLYQYEAKTILNAEGIAVPKSYGVIQSPSKARQLKASYPVMIKAQALVGGRGKAGGIRCVQTRAESIEAARSMFAQKIGDYSVESVLVEEALEYTGACYLGITTNPATSNIVVLASAEGGVDIEEVARVRPEAILRTELPENFDALPPPSAQKIAKFLAGHLGASARIKRDLADLIKKLYVAYQKYDCKVLEINPLLITSNGPIAADAKMVVDDNALFRQGELLDLLGIKAKRHDVAEPTQREQRAVAAGIPYVDLIAEDKERAPNAIYVGLVPGGAGYGIFSIDEVTTIGDEMFEGRVVPLNFMDSGGGPSVVAVREMFTLLMDHPQIDLIVSSRFGGISSCDVYIQGLVECLRERTSEGKRVVPVYGRMVGTDLAAARAFLEIARRETPDQLLPLSMVVGNPGIMADVIREAIQDFAEQRAEVCL